MYRKVPTIYHKIKASVLLLCLGFAILGTCPIQKLLLSAITVKVEASKQSGMSRTVDNNLTCSYNEEVVKAPLIELTKKSDNYALYFILLSALAYLFTSFKGKGSIPLVKRRISLGSPVPLFLKNQVFII